MHSVKVLVNRKTFALKILLNRITTFQSLRIKKAVGQTLVKVFETENFPLFLLFCFIRIAACGEMVERLRGESGVRFNCGGLSVSGMAVRLRQVRVMT